MSPADAFSWRRLLVLPATPIGRRLVLTGGFHRCWPILGPLAGAYRRVVVPRTRLIAVVGTFGKTTTTRAVTVALGRTPHRHLPLNSFSFLAAALFRIRPGDRHAVIEVGINRPGQMARYADLVRPNVTVVTSIGSEHNRSLGTLEATRHEKAEMVRALPPNGLAVLNGDDPNVRWMASQTNARVVTFGFDEQNELRASEVALDWPSGTRCRLEVEGESRELRVRLLGRHQLYPVLAAVAVALAEGVPLDCALERLESLEPTPSRLNVVPLPNGAFLLRDDFKSALETIDAALDLLAEVPVRRRVLVLGDVSEPPGSQGPIYRRLGEQAAGIASRVILVGGRKNHLTFAASARRAGLPAEAITICGSDLRQAVEALRADLTPGDVVLIKGRDTQRLARVALALMGRQVRCELRFCSVKTVLCDSCAMLERGSGPPL